MPIALESLTEPAFLPDAERIEAASAFEQLVTYVRSAPPNDMRLCFQARRRGQQVDVAVPALAIRLFTDVLAQLADGNAVTIVPIHAELTTQQAADLLNVSRPYLIGLLEDERIPYRRVGNRRKIKFEDLIAFKRRDDAHRQSVADELTKEAEQLGLDR